MVARGKLMALVGIDGAGKTTLSRAVAPALTPLGIESLPHRTLGTGEAYVERSMAGVADLLWPKHDTTFDHLLPPEFYVFLKATWYSLFADRVLGPRLRAGRSVLVDGWVHKFMAKMVLDGFPQDRLEVIFSHLPVPELILMLDTDPASVWERRTDFRSHELGLHEGYEKLGRDSFLSYQGKLRDKLLEMAENNGWDVLPLGAGMGVEECTQLLRKRILEWWQQENQQRGTHSGLPAIVGRETQGERC